MKKVGLIVCFSFLTLINGTLLFALSETLGIDDRISGFLNSLGEAHRLRESISVVIGCLMIKTLVCGLTTGNFLYLLYRKRTFESLSLGRLIVASSFMAFMVDVISLNLMVTMTFHLLCLLLLCASAEDGDEREEEVRISVRAPSPARPQKRAA